MTVISPEGLASYYCIPAVHVRADHVGVIDVYPIHPPRRNDDLERDGVRRVRRTILIHIVIFNHDVACAIIFRRADLDGRSLVLIVQVQIPTISDNDKCIRIN
jgi:hypothetical protein